MLFRSLLVLVLSMIAAYWLSKFLARGLIFIAQRIGRRSDNESDEARVTRLRQTETYLSVSIAIIRTLVVVSVGYIAWRILSPTAANSSTSGGLAAIGAGAMFALVAGQTIGIVLRDLTASAIMISENWYKIGDFVKLDPFTDLSGVVKRFTLTSSSALNDLGAGFSSLTHCRSSRRCPCSWRGWSRCPPAGAGLSGAERRIRPRKSPVERVGGAGPGAASAPL